MFLLLVLFIIILVITSLKIYLKLTTGWCRSHTSLVNKTVIVTGANTGIGYETALDFAKRGARVILACRSECKGEEARVKIIDATGNTNIVVKKINLDSFDSVRNFAKEINEREKRLDILVNNAGVMGLGDERTKDGHLTLMQVNYFSPFLLTNLLLNLLKKSAPSRIINVSSAAAKRANLDVTKTDNYVSNFVDYSNSKLCNILFTEELAKKLEGTGVTTFSLHPGVIKSDLFHNLDGIFKILTSILIKLGSKTVEEGAQTTIFCSVAKGIEGFSGEHFMDCRKIKPYKTAVDSGLAKKLWEKSEDIVGLKN